MTDITDQDTARLALAWAEDRAGKKLVPETGQRERDAAVRFILAAVEAPAPTLAEELLYRADLLDNGDPYGDTTHAIRTLAIRAEQMETEHAEQALRIDELDQECDRQCLEIMDLTSERDTALVEVERLTVERDRAKDMSKGWMKAHQELAEHHAETLEDAVPDGAVYATAAGSMGQTQYGTFRNAESLPDPADVPEGQAWVVSIDDMEETAGFKASGFGWICYRELGGTTKVIPSDRITLVSRLVPAPRVITNPDELDTLADGSVVHTRNGDLWKKDSDGMWTYLRPEDAITQRLGPVTVLWEAEVAS